MTQNMIFLKTFEHNIVFKRNKISRAVLKDPFEMLFLEWKFE